MATAGIRSANNCGTDTTRRCQDYVPAGAIGDPAKPDYIVFDISSTGPSNPESTDTTSSSWCEIERTAKRFLLSFAQVRSTTEGRVQNFRTLFHEYGERLPTNGEIRVAAENRIASEAPSKVAALLKTLPQRAVT